MNTSSSRMHATPALGSLALALVLMGCGKSQPTAPKYSGASTYSATPSVAAARQGAQAAASTGGAASRMPAFYDGKLFTINSLELADVAADHVGTNPSHNEIYVTNDLDDEQDFIPVLDAIQGDGFNPLWEQFKIVFNPGVTPHQFFSDNEVLEAAAGPHPEITLVDTQEVYRCSVVGRK